MPKKNLLPRLFLRQTKPNSSGASASNSSIHAALFFPASPTEKQNSGVARLEMFTELTDITTELYHFGPGNETRHSIGRYYPQGDPRSILSYISLWRTFRRHHTRKPYTVLWATMPPILMALYASWLAKRYRLPLIVDVRDPGISSVALAVPPRHWKYKLAMRLEKQIYDRATAICVVTPELGDFICKTFGVTPKKIHLVANATTFKEPPVPLNKETKHIMYAGAFASYQVIDSVLTNIATHRPQISGYHFDFYGYDPERTPNLQEIVRTHNLTDIVTLHPPIPRTQVFAHMRAAYAVLVPIWGGKQQALYEYAIPLKFYEALAMSKPILLFGGTKASRSALNQYQVGVRCKVDGNIFTALAALDRNYSLISRNCTKTRFLRSHEGQKLAKLMTKVTMP